jgi:hypothetical protein
MEENKFLRGEDNPKYKGTYVLEVATGIEYGPLLKAEVLTQFNIGSKKYYEHLNPPLSLKLEVNSDLLLLTRLRKEEGRDGHSI